MAHPNVARVLFDLYLDIEGTRYRCTQTTMSWYTNKIPVASCTLAVGRDARTLEVAQTHRTLFTAGAGRQMLKSAEIVLIPRGQWKPLDEGWTEAGARTIFKGYVTGVGLRMMRGSIRPTVQIIHWLSDLNFSSILSEQSHTSNPGDLSWHSVYCGEDNQTVTKDSHFLGEMVSSGLFAPDLIAADLWAECLHPMFMRITEYDQINEEWGLGVPAQSNKQAQAALKLIYGGEDGTEPGLDYAKMGLNIMDVEYNEVAEAISYAVRSQTMSGWWSTTMWSQLVNNLLPSFMLAIVPQVEHAYIIPYIGGTRPIWKTVDDVDYNYVDTVSIIPRPIQAVGIYAGMTAETSGPNTEDPSWIGIGGRFPPRGEELPKGMIMLKKAPGWLARICQHAESAPNTVTGDPNGEQKPTPTAQCPDAPGAAGNAAGNRPLPTHLKSKKLFDRLAQAIYIHEVLRGRFGVLHGKLRFDIAPGSTIRIRGSQDPFIGEDVLRTDLVAEVSRVTCSLNAEGSKAGTSFQLLNVRTIAENEDDATSIDGHPLYHDEDSGAPAVFKGCPLVESYLFEERE